MKQLLLILSMCLFFISNTNGTHITGGGITYVHDTANTYTFKLVLLHDCASGLIDSLKCTVRSGTNSNNFTTHLSTIQKIPTVCKYETPPCDTGRTTKIGQEKYIFYETIDFNKAPYKSWMTNGACNFVISYKVCCRNSEITTIYSNSSLYLECSINFCNLSKTKKAYNNSPIPTSNYSPILSCGRPVRINHGARDHIDFDSLSYAMITPKKDFNSDIIYHSLYGTNQPLSTTCIPANKTSCKAVPNANPPLGFFFDPFNGDMIFTPKKCSETGVIAIEIKEWRKDSSGAYLLIGKTMEEITLFVINGNYNQTPEIKSGKFNYTVCEGDSIDISIYGEDDTLIGEIQDTVSLSWDTAIANASFKIKNDTTLEKEATFSWRTKIGDANNGLYSFVVLAKDGNCPYEAITYRRFSIKVLPKPKGKIKIKPLCEKLEFSFSTDSGLNAPNNFTWEIIDTKQDTSYSGKNLDTISLGSLGKNYFKTIINNNFNCSETFYDSFELISDTNLSPRITSKDTHYSICAGEKIEFSIFVKDSSVLSINTLDSVSIHLENIPTNASFTLLDSTSREKEGRFVWQTKITDGSTNLYRFIAVSVDDFCPFPDTTYQEFTIAVNPMPTTNIILEESCDYFKYNANLPGNFEYPANYKWDVYKNGALFDSSAISKDSFDSYLDAKYQVSLYLSNKYNCIDTFTKFYNTIQSPASKVNIDLIADCKKINYNAELTNSFNLPATYAWFIADSINQIDSSKLKSDNFNYQNDSTYIINLIVKNIFNCPDTLSSRVKINNGINLPPSISSLKNHYEICVLDTLEFNVNIKENNNSIDTINIGYNSINGANFSMIRNNAGNKTLKLNWATQSKDARDSVYKLLIMAHDNACPKQDTSFKTITIKVNALPIAERKYHEFCGEKGMVFESIIDSTVKQKVTYNWSILDSKNTLVTSSILKTDTFRALNTGKYFSKLEIKDGNSCKNTFMDTVTLRYIPLNIDLGKDTVITDKDSILLKLSPDFKEYMWSTGSTDSMLKLIGKDLDTGTNIIWVLVKDTNGCIYGDTINILVTHTVSLSNFNNSKFLIYPSPVSDVLKIEFSEEIKDGIISIFSVQGKLILKPAINSKGLKFMDIDVSMLAKGTYILNLQSNNRNYTTKIIKK